MTLQEDEKMCRGMQRAPCEDGAEVGGQGTPRIAVQKTARRGGTDAPLAPPEGTGPANTLTADFWPPELGEMNC